MSSDQVSPTQYLSQQMLAQLVESAGDGMLLTSETGVILLWNPAMSRLTGIPAADAVGQPVWEVQARLSSGFTGDQDQLDAWRDAVTDALHGGQIPAGAQEKAVSIIQPGGAVRILQAHAFIIQTDTGYRLGTTYRDVTDQQQADERLENLAKFPAENPNPEMRIGKNGQILYANPASRPILEEWNAAIGEFAPREWMILVRDALALRQRRHFDQRLRQSVFSVSLIPFPDSGYANLYLIDETSRVAAESSLRERENELSSLYQVMPVGVCITDEDGVFMYVNDMYSRLYGYKPYELLGKNHAVILSDGEREQYLAAFPELLRGKSDALPATRQQIRKDGTPFIIEGYYAALTRASGKRLLITVVNDVTSRVAIEDQQRLSEERSRRLALRLEAIARITRQITAIMDLPSLYQLIATCLQEVTNCYYANLILVEGGYAFRVAAACVNPAETIDQGYSQPVESGVIGRAARTGQTQIVADVSQDPDYFPGPSQVAIISELVVPVKTSDHVIGVLDVQYDKADAYDQADIEALGILADQLAVSFENSRLFAETRLRTANLEGLVQASAALRSTQFRAAVLPVILQESTKLLNTAGAALILLDSQTGFLKVEQTSGVWSSLKGERIQPGQGIPAQVMESGQLYIGNHAADNPPLAWSEHIAPQECTALAPLIVSGETIGLLALGRQQPFSVLDASLITTMCDMAAIAIHRETLHEQTIASLQRISALHTVDMAINASLDMHFTLNVLLEQLTGQLGVDGACILLFNPRTLTLDYGAARGFTGLAVTRTHIRMGEQLAGVVALQRRQLRVPNPGGTTTHLMPAALASEGFKTYYGIPLLAKGQVKGVIEILNRTEFFMDSPRIEFLETLADQAAIAIDNAELFNNLQLSNTELTLAYDSTIEGLAQAMELRDREPEGHIQRVTNMSMRLARNLGMSDQEIMHLRRGALLHDVGMLGIPESILHKPGPLSKEEWVEIRRHPEIAFNLLIPISFLKPAADIPYCHHERWDGSGYPRRLGRDQIPLAARIFAVVDVWDAMLSERPWRKAHTEAETCEYIRSQSGLHFDPRVVEEFLKIQQPGGALGPQ